MIKLKVVAIVSPSMLCRLIDWGGQILDVEMVRPSPTAEVPQAAAVVAPAAAQEVGHVSEPDHSSQSEPARDATEVAVVETSAPAADEPDAVEPHRDRREGSDPARTTGAPGPSPADEAGLTPQVLPSLPTVVAPAAVEGGGRPATAWRTAERRERLIAEYGLGRGMTAIRETLGRMPGPPMPVNNVSMWAWVTTLKIRRPAAVAPQAGPELPPPPVLAASAPLVQGTRTVPLEGVPRGLAPRLPAPGFDGKVRAGFEEIKAWAAYYGIAYDGGNMDAVNRRRQMNGQPQIVQEEGA